MLRVMKLGLCLVGWCMTGWLATAPAPAQPAPTPTNTSPPKAIEQPEWLKNFQVERGFHLELVAAEPLLCNPIAMTFDENGRLFVLEVTNNSASAERKGRVRLLEDSGGNGVFDMSTVFADNLDDPTALACFSGGLFVGAEGRILFLKDTKNTGAADVRLEVFKSFGDAANGAGGDVTITGMAWGLDNRIHVATASRGGDVISSSSPVQSIVLRHGSFAFDPRRYLLTDETGGGLSGICFDNRGRKFVCAPTNHLELVMYDARYSARNPFYEMPDAMLNLADNGPASLIRQPGAPTRVSHFTTARGITIYRGNVFPPEYSGDAFVADAAAGVVHRDKLRPSGVEFVAARPADEPESEFLSSRDGSFHPTQVINGPDGALYITGLTRENTASASSGKTNLTVTNASGLGRIYRVVPANFKPPAQVKTNSKSPTVLERGARLQLGKEIGEHLVLLLRHPNAWQRETAARLLYERQDRATIAPLIRLLFDPQAPPLARMHALHVLDGQEFLLAGHQTRALLESHVAKALNDMDERVREHAVLLAEKFLTNGTVSDELWEQLAARAGDASPQVRYQLALTLGQARHQGQAQVLADTLRADLNNRWMQMAVLSSVNESAAELFGLLSLDAGVRGADGDPEFLRQLLLVVGARNQKTEIGYVLNYLSAVPEPELAFRLGLALGNSVQLADGSLVAADANGVVNSLSARAINAALDSNAADGTRIQALRLLTLTSYVDATLAVGLMREWPYLTPDLRREAVAALLSRSDRTIALLLYVQDALVPAADFSAIQIRSLMVHPDPTVRQQANYLFGHSNGGQRQAVVNRFSPALQAAGRVEPGRQIFAARCAGCHQPVGRDNSEHLGLAEAARSGKEKLLIRILDPNREAHSEHSETLVQTRDGATLTGFIASQTGHSVTVCDANGGRWPVGNSNIQSQTSLGFSGMPEGLEAGLNQQDMADLLEYITANQR